MVLHQHLHRSMTLPRDDADFAGRIMLIKQGFSRHVPPGERINTSRVRRGERGLWQQRYWEHLIRDEIDFERHVNTIHSTRSSMAGLHRRWTGRAHQSIATCAKTCCPQPGAARAMTQGSLANE